MVIHSFAKSLSKVYIKELALLCTVPTCRDNGLMERELKGAPVDPYALWAKLGWIPFISLLTKYQVVKVLLFGFLS